MLKCVATAGVNVKPSSKRTQLAIAFKSLETSVNSAHSKTYPALKEQQRQAHREGVKNGQALFEKCIASALRKSLERKRSLGDAVKIPTS